MLANAITLARMPLLAFIVYLMYQPADAGRIAAAPLIVILILMDSLDGIVARSRGESSVLGSVLDIAADRTVELVLWVVFADLDLIPVFIPLVVLARGIFVDAIRSVAPARGLAPFDMLRSPLGRFLVKSPWLRSPYGFVKAVAFCFLAATHALLSIGEPLPAVALIAQIATWVSVVLCIVRGLPVLIEAPQALTEESI